MSATDTQTAPADGMAKFLASRNAKDTTTTAAIVPAVEDPEPKPDDLPIPDDKTPAAVAAAPDAVRDPETGEPIDNPTRNDRRIANLWKREQAALAENRRLAAIIEQRNAAPLSDATVQTAGRPDVQALALDASLVAAAKARIRPEPVESEIGKTYQTYEAFVKDCAIWGGELAAEKRVVRTEQQAAQSAAITNQQTYAKHYAEQGKLYPDFAEKIADAGATLQFQYLGPAITDAVISNPELAGHVTYWLATHAEDVSRIRALPPGRQLVEMGKVMAGLNAPPASEAGGASRRTSRAPAPTSEIGRPAGHASTRLEDAGSYSEFEARRNAQISTTRRR